MLAYSARARRLLLVAGGLFLGLALYLAVSGRGLPYGKYAPYGAAGAVAASLGPLLVWSRQRRLWKLLSRPRSYSLSVEKIPRKKERTFLGVGFIWKAKHTERLRQLTLAEKELPPNATERSGGNWFLHGVGGDSYQKVFLPNTLLTQHLFIMGAPGTGKSRFLELLIEQAVRRGDAVVVIDPKGDERLLDRTYDATCRNAREEAFRFFGLPYAHASVRYNPLRNYVRASELTDRIAMVLPAGGGDAEAFRNFAWLFVNSVVTGLDLLGEPITIAQVEKYCLHNTWLLVRNLIGKYYPKINTAGDLTLMLNQYQAICQKKKRSVLEIDQLVKMAKMNPVYFDKVSSALKPVFAKLLSQGVGYLLCPGHIDDFVLGPAAKRFSPRIAPLELSWKEIDQERQVVYFHLGSMIGPDTASGVSKMALADLQAYIGRKYAYQSAQDFGRITVIVDEAGDVLTQATINLLNKARGAELSLCLAGQSLADLEASLGRASDARRVLGNLATFISLRPENPDDAAFFSEKAGEEPQRAVTEGDSYEPALWQSARSNVEDFVFRSSRSVSIRSEPVVPASVLGELPRFHFLARHSGMTWKGMLPFLGDPAARYSPRLKGKAS